MAAAIGAPKLRTQGEGRAKPKEVKLVSVSTRKLRRERGPARAQLPVPLSNLTKLSKRGALHPAQTKVPLRFSLSSAGKSARWFRFAE